jgi:hypothetical protein
MNRQSRGLVCRVIGHTAIAVCVQQQFVRVVGHTAIALGSQQQFVRVWRCKCRVPILKEREHFQDLRVDGT